MVDLKWTAADKGANNSVWAGINLIFLSGFQLKHTDTHTAASHPPSAVGLRPPSVFIWLSTPSFFISIFLSEAFGTCFSASSPRQEGKINSLLFHFIPFSLSSCSVQRFLLSTWNLLICLQHHLSPPFIFCFYTNSQTFLFCLGFSCYNFIFSMVSLWAVEVMPAFTR